MLHAGPFSRASTRSKSFGSLETSEPYEEPNDFEEVPLQRGAKRLPTIETHNEHHMDSLLSVTNSLLREIADSQKALLREIAGSQRMSVELQREVIRRLEDLSDQRMHGTCAAPQPEPRRFLKSEEMQQGTLVPTQCESSLSGDSNVSQVLPVKDSAMEDVTRSMTLLQEVSRVAAPSESSDVEPQGVETDESVQSTTSIISEADPCRPSLQTTKTRSTLGLVHNVYCRFNVFNIQEINIKKQCIKVDFYFEAAWEMPALTSTEDVDWSYVWQPQIIFTNKLGDLQVQSWNAIDPSYESKFGRPMASWRAKVSGEFTQQFDMHSFPYDTQHVQIGISSDHNSEHCRLMPNSIVKSSAQVAVFSIRDQFDVAFDSDQSVQEIKPRKGAGGEYPQLSIVIDAHRNPTFFVINIILLMFLLVVVYLIAVIPISPFHVADRMEIASNIVLTGVALKLLSAERLPDLPYLTFLDKYLLGSIGLLVAVIAELFTSYRFVPADFAEIFDASSLTAVGGLWLLGHVPIFWPLCRSTWSRCRGRCRSLCDCCLRWRKTSGERSDGQLTAFGVAAPTPTPKTKDENAGAAHLNERRQIEL